MKASNEMLNAYIECALWSSTDDDGEPLDGLGLDVSDDCRKRMEVECNSFLELLERVEVDASELDDTQMGHDFWLSRNGHGAGFWDRGLGEIGDTLHKWAKSFGTCDLYVSDNNEVEVM